MEISVFLGDSYPPQHQIEFPKKHTTNLISYPLFPKFSLLFASLAAIIVDMTEITTTKGNVMENVEFCHLSRTQLAFTMSGKEGAQPQGNPGTGGFWTVSATLQSMRVMG